ncbi:hypothetical protein DPMN_084024 [Dreissena polymorpha]|uniref:Uncharacterized protein n=1 Tax=Dreissena polymorpha TaxID=45954 RepID=A0A9D3Y9V4_DREPO|nr:hypothetical protein DPMN_084024 [Dreissena polymorpha]
MICMDICDEGMIGGDVCDDGTTCPDVCGDVTIDPNGGVDGTTGGVLWDNTVDEVRRNASTQLISRDNVSTIEN